MYPAGYDEVMPFEPLRTDEPLPSGQKQKPDMDTQMIFGCSGFVATSIFSYLLFVWPHFVYARTHLIFDLGMACGLGMPQALILGGYAARKFGLPAASGFVGGAMAGAIFLYLRLEQVMSLRGHREAPQPEFPSAWVWLLPVAWILLALGVALWCIPKREFSGD